MIGLADRIEPIFGEDVEARDLLRIDLLLGLHQLQDEPPGDFAVIQFEGGESAERLSAVYRRRKYLRDRDRMRRAQRAAAVGAIMM